MLRVVRPGGRVSGEAAAVGQGNLRGSSTRASSHVSGIVGLSSGDALSICGSPFTPSRGECGGRQDDDRAEPRGRNINAGKVTRGISHLETSPLPSTSTGRPTPSKCGRQGTPSSTMWRGATGGGAGTDGPTGRSRRIPGRAADRPGSDAGPSGVSSSSSRRAHWSSAYSAPFEAQIAPTISSDSIRPLSAGVEGIDQPSTGERPQPVGAPRREPEGGGGLCAGGGRRKT